MALGLPSSGTGSVARPGRRFGGYLIDLLITLPWYVLGLVLRHAHYVTLTHADGTTYRHLATDRWPAAGTLLFLVPTALYVIGFIAVRGRTIGEQAMGLRVVRVADLGPLTIRDGGTRIGIEAPPPGWGPAGVRWLVLGWASIARAFVHLPIGLTGLLPLVIYGWMLWDADGQGLHDKAARVVVLTTR